MLLRSLLLFCLALVMASSLRAVDVEKFTPDHQPAFAYDQMSRQLFNDAVDSLNEYHKTHAPTRETRYALAAGMINFQPVSAENIQRSFIELGELVKENPADDPGVQAKYLQARIEHVHRDVPNVPEALRHYRELLTSQPSHPIAQRALARIIMLELFTFKPEDPAIRDHQKLVADLSAQTAALTDPLAIRMANLTLMYANFYFQWDPAAGMAEAERALATNIVRERLRGETILMVAVTAEQLGQKEKAIDYYKQFAENHKRDVRTFTVERKLRQMQGLPEPADQAANPPPAPASAAPAIAPLP